MRTKEKAEFLEQLRYRYRREVKLDLIQEYQERDERQPTFPSLPIFALQRYKPVLELSFAVVLGVYVGIASVIATFLICKYIL